jgi:hypothetical protein
MRGDATTVKKFWVGEEQLANGHYHCFAARSDSERR